MNNTLCPVLSQSVVRTTHQRVQCYNHLLFMRDVFVSVCVSATMNISADAYFAQELS